jgi:hypothetical protein
MYDLLHKHYAFFFTDSDTPTFDSDTMDYSSVAISNKLEKFIWWTLIPLTVGKILKWLEAFLPHLWTANLT